MDTACVTPKELAERMGVHEQRVKQARLDPESSGYRPPPQGWEEAVLKLATKRSGAIDRLRQEIDQGEGE